MHTKFQEHIFKNVDFMSCYSCFRHWMSSSCMCIHHGKALTVFYCPQSSLPQQRPLRALRARGTFAEQTRRKGLTISATFTANFLQWRHVTWHHVIDLHASLCNAQREFVSNFCQNLNARSINLSYPMKFTELLTEGTATRCEHVTNLTWPTSRAIVPNVYYRPSSCLHVLMQTGLQILENSAILNLQWTLAHPGTLPFMNHMCCSFYFIVVLYQCTRCLTVRFDSLTVPIYSLRYTW